MDSNSSIFAQNPVNTTFTESGNLICSNMIPARQTMHVFSHRRSAHICFIIVPVFLNRSSLAFSDITSTCQQRSIHRVVDVTSTCQQRGIHSVLEVTSTSWQRSIKSVVTKTFLPHPTPPQLQKTRFYSYGNRAVGINMIVRGIRFARTAAFNMS